jgi:hypothetical protein
MSKDTHQTRLMDYFEKHNSITSLQAIQDLGNTRLAATVCDLRKKGHDIASTSVEVRNRYGGTTHVAKYILQKEVKREKGWFPKW